jgi:hypothetical protein
MSTTNDINIDEIKGNILRERLLARKANMDKLNEKIINEETKAKNEITEVIQKDVAKQIELEERQKDLKKYFGIIKEEKRKQVEEEELNRFKTKCASIVEDNKNTWERLAFKGLIWTIALYGIYCYANSIYNRVES